MWLRLNAAILAVFLVSGCATTGSAPDADESWVLARARLIEAVKSGDSAAVGPLVEISERLGEDVQLGEILARAGFDGYWPAVSALRAGRLDDAERIILKTIPANSPDSSRAHYLLGVIALKRERDPREHFRAALEAQPSPRLQHEAQLALARSAYSRGEFEESVAAYEKLTLSKHEQNELGWAYFMVGRFEDAMRVAVSLHGAGVAESSVLESTIYFQTEKFADSARVAAALRAKPAPPEPEPSKRLERIRRGIERARTEKANPREQKVIDTFIAQQEVAAAALEERDRRRNEAFHRDLLQQAALLEALADLHLGDERYAAKDIAGARAAWTGGRALNASLLRAEQRAYLDYSLAWCRYAEGDKRGAVEAMTAVIEKAKKERIEAIAIAGAEALAGFQR